MKGVIKGLLAEELKNSLNMQKEYGSALEKMPSGCLVRKVISGRGYYYLAKRDGGKVIYSYLGKLPLEEVNKYEAAKKKRAQYRKLFSRVKKQVKFLKGVLRGKEPI